MKMLLVTALLLAVAGTTWAQGATSSVVMGQNAQGQNIILRVIPLKFLDAATVIQLFGGLSTVGGGTASLYSTGGNDFDRGYSRRGLDRRLDSGGNQGYQGYQNARRTSEQYPGYQSPYANR